MQHHRSASLDAGNGSAGAPRYQRVERLYSLAGPRGTSSDLGPYLGCLLNIRDRGLTGVVEDVI